MIWGQFIQKRVFPVQDTKNQDHHWIKNIKISLVTKPRLNKGILIF